MVTLKKGFSLIELLVVIALIGILTAIATASYSTMQKKARDNRRVSDMKSFQNGMEQYYADNNSLYRVGCAIGDTYFPNELTDPKTGLAYVPGPSCDSSSYCFCAELEVESGNEIVACDGTTSGEYYCVRQRQ
jgi:prepilin-type N-terminal cleavage/methylation domain-containing protein